MAPAEVPTPKRCLARQPAQTPPRRQLLVAALVCTLGALGCVAWAVAGGGM